MNIPPSENLKVDFTLFWWDFQEEMILFEFCSLFGTKILELINFYVKINYILSDIDSQKYIYTISGEQIMVFSSLLFTFFFLPLVLFIYFISKNDFRNYILLGASLLFYSYGEPQFVFIMIASIILNYVLALLIDNGRKTNNILLPRVFLIVDIVINIGILFVFKYLDFSVSFINKLFGSNIDMFGIALPIGISFFTFQALSYVIDVYRGTVDVQKNPFYLALYISFFPQLIAGPIVRYSTIEEQITNRKCTLTDFSEGIRRFFLGFCKKVILANNLSVISLEIFEIDQISAVNPLVLWLGAISYSLQIFYDFSGYSDMAIGLGRMFGFKFEENFDHPYISKSITEFWRRWHISLGRWFRDYVYIPLGGSKVSVPRHLLNMFIVWTLTGIWHGADYTFIVWGLWYFLLLVIEKYIVKPEKRKNFIIRLIWQVITLICVNFGWVIFNSANLSSGIQYCMAMAGYFKVPITADPYFISCMREYGIFIISGIIFSTPIANVVSNVFAKHKALCTAQSVVTPVCYGILFLWSVSFLILGVHNPFIYFNF